MKEWNGKSLRAQAIKTACNLLGVRLGTRARFRPGLLTLRDLSVCVYCGREVDLQSVYTVYSVFGFLGNYMSVMAPYEGRLLY